VAPDLQAAFGDIL